MHLKLSIDVSYIKMYIKQNHHNVFPCNYSHLISYITVKECHNIRDTVHNCQMYSRSAGSSAEASVTICRGRENDFEPFSSEFERPLAIETGLGVSLKPL